MPQLDNIIKGLEIIKKHDPDSYFAAEHDEIFAGDSNKIPKKAKAELKELGWHVDEDLECMKKFV